MGGERQRCGAMAKNEEGRKPCKPTHKLHSKEERVGRLLIMIGLLRVLA
jgi:hypothetical protein